MYAFRLRRKISSKHLLSRKGVHFHRKNRFSHNKKTNHRKNRFSHKKKTNLRLLDTPNELNTLLYRTSSHTTISLTPVKIYPSSVNEMHLNFSFFNDISIVSSSFRAGVLAFHGTWHLLIEFPQKFGSFLDFSFLLRAYLFSRINIIPINTTTGGIRGVLFFAFC